tara:strand:+ start:129 stop:554 length:426 start_codon:yes stop_codon:yes gene_type:complete
MSKKDVKEKQIEMELSFIEMNDFYNSILHLGSLPLRDLDLMINVSKTKNIVKSEYDLYNEMYKIITEESCLKDSNGKPILVEGKSFQYKDKKEELSVLSSIDELKNKKVVITITPFNVNKLEGIEGITANMLSSLNKMIIY